jgi:hypothetical protein
MKERRKKTRIFVFFPLSFGYSFSIKMNCIDEEEEEADGDMTIRSGEDNKEEKEFALV